MTVSAGTKPVRRVPTKSQRTLPDRECASLDCVVRERSAQGAVDRDWDGAPGLWRWLRGLLVALVLSVTVPGWADTPGSVFITGQDSDYDAAGENPQAAIIMNRIAIQF